MNPSPLSEDGLTPLDVFRARPLATIIPAALLTVLALLFALRAPTVFRSEALLDVIGDGAGGAAAPIQGDAGTSIAAAFARYTFANEILETAAVSLNTTTRSMAQGLNSVPNGPIIAISAPGSSDEEADAKVLAVATALKDLSLRTAAEKEAEKLTVLGEFQEAQKRLSEAESQRSQLEFELVDARNEAIFLANAEGRQIVANKEAEVAEATVQEETVRIEAQAKQAVYIDATQPGRTGAVLRVVSQPYALSTNRLTKVITRGVIGGLLGATLGLGATTLLLQNGSKRKKGEPKPRKAKKTPAPKQKKRTARTPTPPTQPRQPELTYDELSAQGRRESGRPAGMAPERPTDFMTDRPVDFMTDTGAN